MAKQIDSSTLFELLTKLVELLGFGYLKSITLISDNNMETVIRR